MADITMIDHPQSPLLLTLITDVSWGNDDIYLVGSGADQSRDSYSVDRFLYDRFVKIIAGRAVDECRNLILIK